MTMHSQRDSVLNAFLCVVVVVDGVVTDYIK